MSFQLDGAVLRQLVVRLSEQLARRQGRPPPDAADTAQLSDTRRLPPLLDAYDQVQAELSEQADALRADLAELRRQLDGLTAENESLHSQLADAQSKPGVTHQEWRSVSENARLVLEENQLLKQQAQILKDKQSEADAETHRQETAAAARVADLERAAAELRSRLQGECQLRDQLAAERDQLQLQLQSSVPREQHNSAVAECRRLFEELRSRYTSERLSLLADTEALQAERRRLVVQLTDAATQRTASETKLRAANKSITRLERRVSSLQGDLDSAQKANSEASEHLAEVLSATDQLMAERSQMARLSTTQMTDGDRLLEKISEERAHSLRLKDKVKAVRDESQQQLEQMRFEMGDQTRSHESRLAEYERQLAYLRSRLNDQQLEADHLRAENRRVSQEMGTLSRAATAENQKLKEQLQNVPERDSSSSGGHK